MNKYLGIIFLLLALKQPVNCQPNQEGNLYVFKTEEFSISYPSILSLDDSGINGSKFILYTEKDNETDDFIENINLVSQDLTSLNLDLDGFIEIAKKELKDVGEIIESKKLTNRGYEYHKLIYTSTQNGVQLTFLQHGLIANKELYMLTFSGKADVFEEYRPEMEQVMLSFTPLNPSE